MTWEDTIHAQCRRRLETGTVTETESARGQETRTTLDGGTVTGRVLRTGGTRNMMKTRTGKGEREDGRGVGRLNESENEGTEAGAVKMTGRSMYIRSVFTSSAD